MNGLIKHKTGQHYTRLLPALAFAASLAGYMPAAHAGATFKIDETKWVSIGAGLRTSFRSVEGAANAGKWSNDFNLDNIRLYLNGQIHKYIKLEFNTDCQTCSNGGEMRILVAFDRRQKLAPS